MKYCLIIDDTNQNAEIEQLETMSKESGFPIECYHFNPTDRKYLRQEQTADGVPDFVIDKDLILEGLQQIPLSQIDLVATDYKLSDNSLTGLDIVKFLKEKKWRGKTPFVIYSSDSDEIKEKLQAKIKTLIEDKDNLNEFLEEYFDTNPNKIFARKIDREGQEIPYTVRIYEFLKKNKTPLNNKLYQKLSQNSEHIFNNIFPSFEGRTLGQLSELVLKNTAESDMFEDEFLDRSVAHFIYLQE